MRSFALGLLALLLSAGAVRAETYLIRPDGTGDYPTIQDAINQVSWGSTIELADGTFQGPGNRDLQYHGKPILIRSASGNPETCVIDCNGTADDPHRGFLFGWGEGPGSRLQGVTIANGYAAGADPPETLEACGGAVLINSSAAPTFVDVIFRDNTGMIGGGVCAWPGSPSFTRCTFLNNTGWWGSGGGLWTSDGSPTLVDCLFEGNLGHQAGGGASIRNTPEVTITGCWFRNNRVEYGYGAGLSLFLGINNATVERCLFTGNHFDEWGYGGGLESFNANTTVSGCTFYGNGASTNGGGGILAEGNVTVENTIIAFNAGGGSAVCEGGAISMTCCDLYGNTGGDWIDCIAGQAGVNGNISLDPLFCAPGSENFRLRENSPCAPYSPPNPECDLIGAFEVGCVAAGIAQAEPAAGPRLLLAPARPNPFHVSTSFSLTITGAGPGARVALSICDAAGRRVRELTQVVNGSQADVSWDGTDATGAPVASGMYYLHARWNGTEVGQRVLRIR